MSDSSRPSSRTRSRRRSSAVSAATAHNAQVAPLLQLPQVLVTEVLVWLPAAVLGGVSCVCTALRDEHVPAAVYGRAALLGLVVPDPPPCKPLANALDFLEELLRRRSTLAAGEAHTLCLQPSPSALYSWGGNSDYEEYTDVWGVGEPCVAFLGHGRQVGKNVRSPRRVRSIIDAQGCREWAEAKMSLLQVSAGASHSMAVTNRGEVLSWGDASDGQLGHGRVEFGQYLGRDDYETAEVPMAIHFRAELARELIVQVSCGHGYSLMLSRSGRVYSCGSRGNGELGHADWPKQPHAPKRVTNLGGIVQVSAGSHSLAVSRDGKLYSWGWMANGPPCRGPMDAPLNAPSVPPPHVPGEVAFLLDAPGAPPPRVIKACAGVDHGLIITDDGGLFSYGRGDYGELGHGDRHSSYRRARRVALAHRVADAKVGQFFSAALTDTGDVYTWGQGFYGKLGHGDEYPDEDVDEAGGECCLLPQRVQGLPPVAEIALGSCHALARLRNGELLAWGCNDAGQLGQGHACNEERHGHPERVRFRSAGEDDEEDEEDEEDEDEDEDNEDEDGEDEDEEDEEDEDEEDEEDDE